MLHTAELHMTDSVAASDSDIETFPTNVARAICSKYHAVLQASPGATILGQSFLLDVPFLADWTKIGDHMQNQIDLNTLDENKAWLDWHYNIVDKVLMQKDEILCKSERLFECDPWTINQFIQMG